MKKTRREKDWAYANLLGLQMLKQGEIAGILHITDAKKLREICQSNDIEWSLSNQRPLLKLAIEKDPRLERYIKAEKEFWTKLDDLRLTVYEKAWARYGQELQKEATKLLPMAQQAQNEALVELGERYLDPSPLHTVGWDDLLGQAKEHTRAMFENIDQELLPTPPAFPEDTNEISR